MFQFAYPLIYDSRIIIIRIFERMSNQHKSRHSCVSVGWFVNFFERWIDETPEDSKYGRCIRRICSNRWIRTTTYGLVTVTCCAVYFGWQVNYAEMYILVMMTCLNDDHVFCDRLAISKDSISRGSLCLVVYKSWLAIQSESRI